MSARQAARSLPASRPTARSSPACPRPTSPAPPACSSPGPCRLRFNLRQPAARSPRKLAHPRISIQLTRQQLELIFNRPRGRLAFRQGASMRFVPLCIPTPHGIGLLPQRSPFARGRRSHLSSALRACSADLTLWPGSLARASGSAARPRSTASAAATKRHSALAGQGGCPPPAHDTTTNHPALQCQPFQSERRAPRGPIVTQALQAQRRRGPSRRRSRTNLFARSRNAARPTRPRRRRVRRSPGPACRSGSLRSALRPSHHDDRRRHRRARSPAAAARARFVIPCSSRSDTAYGPERHGVDRERAAATVCSRCPPQIARPGPTPHRRCDRPFDLDRTHHRGSRLISSVTRLPSNASIRLASAATVGGQLRVCRRLDPRHDRRRRQAARPPSCYRAGSSADPLSTR